MLHKQILKLEHKVDNLKPGLVAYYNLRHEIREGLFSQVNQKNNNKRKKEASRKGKQTNK